MAEVKNLANCDPIEFLVQTEKIRKHVENWLTVTEIGKIRKELPDIPSTATADERRAAVGEQIKKNFFKILGAIAGDHAEETAVLLGLLCFVEPEDVRKYPMKWYMKSIGEIIDDPDVLGFFISLAKLASVLTSR